ncbi:DNA-binding transcriptional regulator, AcrR family [Amycolatopsis lurida]|uniref:TetR family transcriptional regulator n=1 Tax=Amycolatopsis lurida NRRL 2430 TaxID=1460371 RepID=A0A2P2FMQ9_AMYLU|nr:TetR/AcrR family transcriptional regulator [Amycolatopsis lurida]KFU78023.1 TetR family transcriptional regulator [Amycolatopsis lurida NRRL 2430]SEE64062.1 DNA-binding transcriptional regulator, AcrR family [Amycolatopsis lurida]
MTPEADAPRPDGRAARWAGQRERRRREFVDAALRAIATHGPEVSTEQIADEAGVARTRVYKHFDDASDLQRAIADRAVRLITAELAPLWDPSGTPMQLITVAVGAHTGWLAEYGNLYRYLARHSQAGRRGGDAITDVKTAIAGQLSTLFEHYLDTFDLDGRIAEPLAFGLVGLVDTSAARWLENPGGIELPELAALLVRWIWRVIDDTLRERGIELDPHSPLLVPGA